MESIELEFKGPFRHNCLKTANGLPEDVDKPGVYIWGFEIRDRFIPYYTGKSQSSIRSRLLKHIFDLTKPDSTYMRLNKSYIEGEMPYYLDPKFPLITRNWNKKTYPCEFKVDNKTDYFRDKIDYLNNRAFLSDIKEIQDLNTLERGDYPISNVSNIDDYLSSAINNNKFMFVYASCSSKNYHNLPKNVFFETIEAYTKFSLKGKTVSKSLNFNDVSPQAGKISFNIIIKNGHLDIFKNSPSLDFPGYTF